jgi:hypothetical protein
MDPVEQIRGMGRRGGEEGMGGKGREGRGLSMPAGSCGATGRGADTEIITQSHNENSGCRQIVGLYIGGVTSRIMQTTFITSGVLRTVHIDWRLVMYLYTRLLSEHELDVWSCTL